MRSITRREALGALVSLPGVSLLKSLGLKETASLDEQRSAASLITTLNVVFHGLFAFVMWQKQNYIQVIAPIVSNHFYFGGGKDLSRLQALSQGQTYTLNGLNSGVFSNGFDASQNSVFENIHDVDYRYSYLQIILPFPDNVISLRKVPLQSTCGDFYTSAPKLKQKPTSLPLIHVFSYTLAGSSQPTLVPLNNLNLDATSSTYNLHLRAEPKVDMAGGPIGFASLNSLFPELQATLNPCYDNYYASPDVSYPTGLSVLDECTLEELSGKSCPPPSIEKNRPRDGKLVNCHSVVVLE